MLRRGVSIVAGSVLTLVPALARAQIDLEPTAGSFQVRDTTDGVITFEAPDRTTNRIAVGCVPTVTFGDESGLYLACAEGVVVRIVRPANESNYVARHDHVDGEVVRFYRDGGHVWIEYRNTRARLADESGPTLTMGAVGENPRSPRTAERCPPVDAVDAADNDVDAEVVALMPGEAIIDFGADDGLFVGQRVALEPPATDASSRRMRERVVGRITRIESHRARVRIAINEHPRLHWTATPTELPATSSIAGPARAAGMFMLGATFGVGIAVDPAGVIPTGSLSAAYRFEAPFFIALLRAPPGGRRGRC
jgi:hypothetical protein